MKRIWPVFVLALALLLAGCGAQTPAAEDEATINEWLYANYEAADIAGSPYLPSVIDMYAEYLAKNGGALYDGAIADYYDGAELLSAAGDITLLRLSYTAENGAALVDELGVGRGDDVYLSAAGLPAATTETLLKECGSYELWTVSYSSGCPADGCGQALTMTGLYYRDRYDNEIALILPTANAQFADVSQDDDAPRIAVTVAGLHNNDDESYAGAVTVSPPTFVRDEN